MNTKFFLGMLLFGALIGGSLGGFNFRHIKGDGGRDQRKVGTRMVIGVIAGAVFGGLIGFFVR